MRQREAVRQFTQRGRCGCTARGKGGQYQADCQNNIESFQKNLKRGSIHSGHLKEFFLGLYVIFTHRNPRAVYLNCLLFWRQVFKMRV